MAWQPTVLYPLTLPALLDYILSTQPASSPTTLVICSDRPTFLEELARSLRQQQESSQSSNLKELLVPTLHNLSTARHVKLAFCASVQALLAYLAAYDRPGYVHVDESEGKERLVLVNLLALHESTSSFSVQGLSRTFAAAVETALRTEAKLHLVECEDRRSNSERVPGDDMIMPGDDMIMPGDDMIMPGDDMIMPGDDIIMPNGEDDHHAPVQRDLWSRDVSILNVSARRFGSGAGERAWAGRTVKASQIAARWFHFQDLSNQTTKR